MSLGYFVTVLGGVAPAAAQSAVDGREGDRCGRWWAASCSKDENNLNFLHEKGAHSSQ